jgi:LysR family transcriptional regulator, hydrogen peroxide-inducible genes activator
LDLTQIRYFLALAKTLNFTRAAETCNVTQPALTKSIQRLEEELGGQLLLRERSHTQLTPLGVAMLPLLQQTFDAAETARLSAIRFRQHDLAVLRVGLGAWVEPSVIMPLILSVSQRFHNLQVTVKHGDVAALNEWLLNSDIDVLLTAQADRLTDRANRWRVFSDPIVVLLPEHHALSVATSLDIDQIRKQVMVGRVASATEGRIDSDLEERFAITPAIRHRGSTDEHVYNFISAGMGVSLSTGRRTLPPDIARRALEPEHTLDVSVAAIAGRPLSRAADAFLRLARARDWGVADA